VFYSSDVQERERVKGEEEEENGEFFLDFGIISQDPPELPSILKYPLIFKNSQFNPLNFQLLSIWTNPYKLGHTIFQKDQNTPDFYFKKN
jgi:hypothetical protein